MKMKLSILLVVSCVMFLAVRGSGETVKTAAALIEQAHEYDNMYTLGPKASQHKAISFYQSALSAEPDDKQRLHILYRMAQLYGSSYDLSRGEKPNFVKAIKLNKQIAAKYPPKEPLVYKAMGSISDHYTTLREFESALKWAKKILEYDTTEQLESGQIDTKSVDRIRRYQRIAVNQIAYTADHIDYLRTHGELRHLSDKYYGTFIADRADELLAENMDKMPSLWAPTNDPFSPSGPALQAAVPTPAAHNKTAKGIPIRSETIGQIPQRQETIEPDTNDIPQQDKHVAKEPRAPPARYSRKYLVVAAGLIVLVLAAGLIKKKKTPYI